MNNNDLQPNAALQPDLQKASVMGSGILHPKVERFAADMTRELKANEHKGPWEEWNDVQEMIAELEWHKAKLLMALREGDKSRVREHLADCGNILMFIGNAGHLYDSHCP